MDGTFPPGKAAPIAAARLRVGEVDVVQPVAEDDKAAVFTVQLKPGNTRLKTWFYDAQGKELCGAIYVEVRYAAGP